jgi:alpha-tubulin suppressor-like RCC1 family protein
MPTEFPLDLFPVQIFPDVELDAVRINNAENVLIISVSDSGWAVSRDIEFFSVSALYSMRILLLTCCLCVGFAISAFGARLSVEDGQSFFIDDAGILWGWGMTTSLGLPYRGDGVEPPTPLLTQVQAVAAGMTYVLALRQNGELWGWGNNDHQQLTGAMRSPVKEVPAPRKILSDVAQIAAGVYQSFAVKRDGSLWGWGLNSYGMGLKLKKARGEIWPKKHEIAFTRILPPTVVQIAPGGEHTLALVKKPPTHSQDDAHILMVWGRNTCNQLGDYDVRNQETPLAVHIDELQGKRIRKIAAGSAYNLVLTEDGELWKLGEFGLPPCREGLWPEELAPKKIEELSDVVDFAADRWSVWVLKRDGTLWGWGYTEMQYETSWMEKLIHILSDVREIAAGGGHVLALKNDGTVWARGKNKYGELGDGTKNLHEGPVQVIIPPLDKADTSHLVR